MISNLSEILSSGFPGYPSLDASGQIERVPGVAATILVQPAFAADLTITFQSATYRDFRQILTREPATGTVTVRANLNFPEQARDRYPAVIVVHGLGGYRDTNEGYVAAELRKSGFATLTYDSFAARGTTGAAMQGIPGYLPAGVADAYAALRLLGERTQDRRRSNCHCRFFVWRRSGSSDGI